MFSDPEVFKALIGALATVIVAALGLYGVIRSAKKPSATKPPEGNTGPALEQFNGTQNEFMALVVADNRILREGQEAQKAEMAILKESVESIKLHNETFFGAVRRYILKLATAWGEPGPMPWPDDNDFHILEDTLPGRSAGKTIARKEN